MIQYKQDILELIYEKTGQLTYEIRKGNVIPEGLITKLRNWDTNITVKSLDTLCRVTELQPGDILEYTEEESENPYEMGLKIFYARNKKRIDEIIKQKANMEAGR